MTEKQRWLLRDAEQWRDAAMNKLGRYGPHKVQKEPSTVRAARRAIASAERLIRDWEKASKLPWEKARDAIQARYMATKRVILFEKTEDALKALRALTR